MPVAVSWLAEVVMPVADSLCVPAVMLKWRFEPQLQQMCAQVAVVQVCSGNAEGIAAGGSEACTAA